jgi:virulence factor Mce-like protein
MTTVRGGHRGPRLSLGVLGALGVIFSLIFIYGAFTKRVPLVTGYRVKAMLTSSNELRRGSPVRIAGIDVGKVVKLEHGPGSTAIATMQLKDSGRPLHKDAEVRIRPRLFLEGGFYIDLRPGSPSAPEIPDDGTIPLGQTTIPVQFDQVLTGGFSRSARDSFQRLLVEAGTALDDGGAQDLGAAQKPSVPALRDLAIVAEAARGIRRHDVSQTVSSVSKITTALASNEEALGGLVTGLARTTEALADEQQALGETVRGLDAVLRHSPAALTAIDRATPAARGLARDLGPALRIAPPVLRGAVRLLDQLDRATRPAEVPRLVSYFKPAVNTLPQLSERLTTLFPLVDPVTDCVRDKALPILEAKIDDGALSSGRPVWQDLAHGLVGVNSGAQNFDANGPNARYLFTAGSDTISLGDFGGLGTLVGTGSEPIAGVRPRWNGPAGKPPFMPDKACRDQALVSLKADASPTVATFKQRSRVKAPRVTRAQFEKAVKRFAKAGR